MSISVTQMADHSSAEQLDQYFQLRHRIFNEWLGWGLSNLDGREMDQFDRADTVYVLALDERGRTCGGTRLIPTTSEYMIESVFPEIWEDQEMIHDPDVWEMSRFVIDWSSLAHDRARVREVSGEIGAALAEYCILNDIYEFVSILGTRFEPHVTEVFGEPIWMSRETSLGGVPSLGVRYEISYPQLRATRQKFHLASPSISKIAEVIHA